MRSSALVFCSSSEGVAPAFFEEMRLLGRLFAEQRIQLIYGGARVGLMGAMAEACLQAGGQVVGVIPEYLNQEHIVHPGLTELIVVSDLLDRKKKMLSLADIAIASPGGVGTLDEITEVIALKQLQEHKKPIVFHNFLDFWDPFLEFLQELHLRRMINQDMDDLFVRCASAGDVVEYVCEGRS